MTFIYKLYFFTTISITPLLFRVIFISKPLIQTGMEFKPRKDIIEMLERYIANSPNPHEKKVACSRGAYSVIDILNEIARGTPFGRAFYKSLEATCDEEGLKEL